MKSSWRFALISVACLAMSGCHGHHFGAGKAPTGQVAATVNGQEITQLELNAELAGVNLPTDPKARKAVEIRALQAIIGRTLLAQAAKQQGLDKTPEFAMQRTRADEILLGQALQSKLAKDVPPPTSEEVSRFILDNPDIFDQRKIFTVDQIRMAQPTDPDFMKKIQPLNTMPDVEALLTSEHVDYRRGTAQLDAVGADPKVIAAVVKLPPNTVFVIASGGGLLINEITGVKVQPLTGDDATKYATALLTRQHVQEALSRQVKSIFSQGAASVRYNPTYQPPKSPAPAAASSAPAPSQAPTNE
jgi:peptidyl-prolyl cis-trans isomerase C